MKVTWSEKQAAKYKGAEVSPHLAHQSLPSKLQFMPISQNNSPTSCCCCLFCKRNNIFTFPTLFLILHGNFSSGYFATCCCPHFFFRCPSKLFYPSVKSSPFHTCCHSCVVPCFFPVVLSLRPGQQDIILSLVSTTHCHSAL